MKIETGLEAIKIKARLVRSFTQNPEYGNPAGVVRDANKLTDEQILKAAQKLGFPESAFLQTSDVADFKLRLFSVKQEVNSCVTATIAAAHVVMKEQNLSHIVFETKIGNREISQKEGGLLLMKQPEVKFMDVHIDRNKIAVLLNISIDSLGDSPIVLASAGTPKLLIPIKTLNDLFSIKPNLDEIAKYCEEIGGRGFYPFTLETKSPDSDFHARAFNPQDGITEDPVTGVAAAALTAYFRKYGIISKEKLIGEQGYIINKPGEIVIEVKGDNLYVGGYATDSGEIELEI